MTNANDINIDDIIDNPAKHGFTWGSGDVAKAGVTWKNVPYIEHKNVALMMATFGDDYFLDCANTRSGRVRDQTIRDDIYDNRKLATNDREMKRIIIERALGNKRSRRGRTVAVFFSNDGEEHATKELAIARNRELAAAEANA